MRECAILMRLVFMGCSLLKWQLVMFQLQRQLTFRILKTMNNLYKHSYISQIFSMIQDVNQFLPFDDDKHDITVTACNPTEKKSTLSSHTVYTVRGQDREGSFQHEKRYSDFDHLRLALCSRWPGCIVPPLPPKKIIGNSAANFIEERCIGLDLFLRELAKLKHLWYSKQFQMFLRGSGDFEKQMKNLPHESAEDLIKKYDESFPRLTGRGQDTIILGRVLEFSNYCRRIIPTIENFKQMALEFITAKNANNQQFSVLLNYVLPEYQKSCLAVYCNKLTEGKFIFNEHSDQKLAEFIEQFKKLIAEQQFEQLYRNLQLEQREMQSFLDIFKTRDGYEAKLKDLKSKEKDLQLELIKLNAGKQGVFASLVSKLENSKAKANHQLELVKEEIKMTSFILDMVMTLMGHFQVPRYRQFKLKMYYETIHKIAAFQVEYATLRAKICEHVLDNHNLL